MCAGGCLFCFFLFLIKKDKRQNCKAYFKAAIQSETIIKPFASGGSFFVPELIFQVFLIRIVWVLFCFLEHIFFSLVLFYRQDACS